MIKLCWWKEARAAKVVNLFLIHYFIFVEKGLIEMRKNYYFEFPCTAREKTSI
jgi:hypothetical protein